MNTSYCIFLLLRERDYDLCLTCNWCTLVRNYDYIAQIGGDGIATTVLLRATIDYFTYLLCIYHVTNYAKMDYLGQKYLFLINFSCYTCTWLCILLFKCLYWTSLLNVLFLLAGFSVWRFTVAGKSCTQVWA